jgi:hypothetical protein
VARDGEVLLGALSFLSDFTYHWMEEPEKTLTRKGLLEVSNLGATGMTPGVGRELMLWLGAVAHLKGQEVSVFADDGSERFYERLGLTTFSAGLASARYLWRKTDLPALEAEELTLAD